jgi:hypothetical protein
MLRSPGTPPTPATRSRRRKRPKPDAYLADISDRKLKGKLRHKERLYLQSSKETAKIGEWLAPAEAGTLEAEGANGMSCRWQRAGLVVRWERQDL